MNTILAQATSEIDNSKSKEDLFRLIIKMLVAVIGVLGFVVWYLYDENKTQRAEHDNVVTQKDLKYDKLVENFENHLVKDIGIDRVDKEAWKEATNKKLE